MPALNTRELDRDCRLETRALDLLEQAMQRLSLSARAYHRVLKLARTIADLDDREALDERHVAEAIGYRLLDRPGTLHDPPLRAPPPRGITLKVPPQGRCTAGAAGNAGSDDS